MFHLTTQTKMINILQSNIDFEAIKELHWEYVSCYVSRRLTGQECKHACKGYCKDSPDRKPSHKSINFDKFGAYILDGNRLKNILSGSPNMLEKECKDFTKFILTLYKKSDYKEYLDSTKKQRQNFHTEDLHKFFNDISAVFNYTWLNGLELSKEFNPYKLTEALGIRACTYCNRSYTVTRRKGKNGKLMRPQLDHWYPKSKFPLLAVSFHNLIPCCSSCNSSVKSDDVMDLTKHVHPYMTELKDDDMTFDYYHSTLQEKYRVFVKKSGKASGKMLDTTKFLQIDEMYNAHIPELKDLLNLRQAYSENYIDSIADFFPNSEFTKEEVYRMLFGVELYEKEFFRRPFSKFKYDILVKLEMIKDIKK